jgi:copper chaperone CopZ
MAQPVLRIFKVKDIHCEACEDRIRTALLQLPGVRSAKADRKARQVEVRLDLERTSEEEVSSRLDYLGFSVIGLSEGPTSR